MGRLPTLLDDLGSALSGLEVAIRNPAVWSSIGVMLLLAAFILIFGTGIARLVGLLTSDEPAGETLGVGLATGLITITAFWATLGSGGRSSFAPIAVGFAVAFGLASIGHLKRRQGLDRQKGVSQDEGDGQAYRAGSRRRSLVIAALTGAVLLVAVSLLYGSTIAPSPRGGGQPLEFTDPAYYAVLGSSLVATGTEDSNAESGFGTIPGLPVQTWYHWGEIWLAALVIKVFGSEPMFARNLVVLPLLVLAAAGMTGTVVRRMANTASPRAFAFGFVTCLFWAPLEVPTPNVFTGWPSGLVFQITLYGVAAVAVPVGLYFVAIASRRRATWTLGVFVGATFAFLLPAHIVVALLALVGLGSTWALVALQRVVRDRHLPVVHDTWLRPVATGGILLAATAAWGGLTGHALGASGSAPSDIPPFSGVWRQSVAVVIMGAASGLAIPVAWLLTRHVDGFHANLYLGTMAVLVAGAIGWGAMIGNFNTFHLLYGAIAIFATPAAAVGIWVVARHLSAHAKRRAITAFGVICAAQLVVGAVLGVARLVEFGPPQGQLIPLAMIDAINELPADARLAYACQPLMEVSFAEPSLLAIEAHTGREVVPMCFEGDVFGTTLGTPRSQTRVTPNASFEWAPQRILYESAASRPSGAIIAAFLKEHGIHYIYADAVHPNSLVANAIPIASDGATEILRVP